MRIFNYFLMFCKRLIRKPSFLIIILLMPLSAYIIMHFSTTEQSGVNVAIYNAGTDTLSNEIESYLLQLDGMVNFESCNNADEVYEKVKMRKADCGYILPADLSERVAKNVKLGAIESVRSPGSTMTAFANEFVVTAFLNVYSYDILKDCTLESGDFDNMDEAEVTAKLQEYYRKYLISDDTFSFRYENESNEFIDEIDIIPDFLIHSTYGICALFIFIAALAGGLMIYKDKSSGIFALFKPHIRALLQYFDILAPTFVCAIAAIISFVALEGTDKLLLTIIKTFSYVLLCSGCCFLHKLLIKSPVIYSSSLPVWIIGSMAFCPVFIDIASLVPRLTTLKYIFLPTYYLNSGSFSTTMIMLACGIVISISGILLSYRTEKKI